MNEREARELLAERIDELRLLRYRELLLLLNKPQATEVVHESGQRYQLEAQVFWDDRPGGDLRVIVSVDDGGWRAFAPLTSDFIKSPSDQFVGEEGSPG